MTGTEKLRLFVAFDLPPRLLEAIAESAAPLRVMWSSARWVPTENQHVTLKFLGSVPAARLDAIGATLAAVASGHAPGRVRPGGFGVFPSPRRARVLWVGFVDPADLLTGLAEDLDSALKPLGFEREKRGFTPHLTLARFKEPQPVGTDLLGEGPLGGGFDVDGIVLYRSHLSPKGARYEPLEAFPLRSDRGGADP